MKAHWMIALFTTIMMSLTACRLAPPTPIIITALPIEVTATHKPPIAAATISTDATPTPFPDSPEMTRIASIQQEGIVEVPVLLEAAPQKLVLGPSSDEGAYLVEIVPGPNVPNGAHIVMTILPESDGQVWNDTLTYSSPELTRPVEATAHIRRINSWPVAGRYLMELNGDWVGMVVNSQAAGSGYMVEVNPLEPQPSGQRIEKARVLPEFFNGQWQDVLRIQTPGGQMLTPVEVVVYATPADLAYNHHDLSLKDGGWPGWGIDRTDSPAAYLVGVEPLTNIESHIEAVLVQQEFDGHQWNSVVRAMLGENRPALNVRVYLYWIP